jgi:tryptophan synthase alpha chain
VVVGSAIVEMIGQHGEAAPAPVRQFVSALAAACARKEQAA